MRPTRVTRGSSSILNCGPSTLLERSRSASCASSAFATMVRNLRHRKGARQRPCRRCPKKTGPRNESFDRDSDHRKKRGQQDQPQPGPDQVQGPLEPLVGRARLNDVVVHQSSGTAASAASSDTKLSPSPPTISWWQWPDGGIACPGSTMLRLTTAPGPRRRVAQGRRADDDRPGPDAHPLADLHRPVRPCVRRGRPTRYIPAAPCPICSISESRASSGLVWLRTAWCSS